MSIRKILVPVDFSDQSHRAVDLATEFAKGLGASVTLLHAEEVLVYRGVRYVEILNISSAKEERKAVESKLADWLGELEGAGVSARSMLVEGDPRKVISRVAEEEGTDLIIMGSRGHSMLRDVLMGSVAEHTMQTAGCAVLISKGS